MLYDESNPAEDNKSHNSTIYNNVILIAYKAIRKKGVTAVVERRDCMVNAVIKGLTKRKVP
jgi:hypothetical protein